MDCMAYGDSLPAEALRINPPQNTGFSLKVIREFYENTTDLEDVIKHDFSQIH